MYVCICEAVTDNELQTHVEAGASSVREVSRCSGLGTQCGKCVCYARERIEHHRNKLQSSTKQVA